jgi:hypothetical protein
LEGVNPPNFEIYISSLISSLGGNGCCRGLDKVSAVKRFGDFRARQAAEEVIARNWSALRAKMWTDFAD